MEGTENIVVMITCPGIEPAQKLVEVLLDNRKVACVNVVPGIRSFYWWQGKKESATEVLLIAKTRRELLSEVVELIRTNHPYEIPEIIALPIIGGFRNYLDWIGEETQSKR